MTADYFTTFKLSENDMAETVFVLNVATCMDCGRPRGECTCGTTRNQQTDLPDLPFPGEVPAATKTPIGTNVPNGPDTPNLPNLPFPGEIPAR